MAMGRNLSGRASPEQKLDALRWATPTSKQIAGRTKMNNGPETKNPEERASPEKLRKLQIISISYAIVQDSPLPRDFCSGPLFHFVLPAICLLVAWPSRAHPIFVLGWRRPLSFLPIAIFMCARGCAVRIVPLLSQRPSDVLRMIYGAILFRKLFELPSTCKAHTNPTDTIAVLGSEPEIYFYSHRHSATGYIIPIQ